MCLTKDVPPNATERDDGWRTFRIQGTLDFSLIGILSEISGILADNKIGIFAVSTYNTDKGLSNKCFVMSVCVKCSMPIPLDYGKQKSANEHLTQTCLKGHLTSIFFIV